MPEPLADALAEVRALLLDEEALVRAVAAGRRRGHPLPWRRVELRPVELRSGRRLQVVRLDERQAHTANAAYGDAAAAAVDELLALPFGNWHVETTDETLQLRVTKRGEAQLHRAAASRDVAAPAAHDRAKQRLLDPAEPFLAELGVTTRDGQVKPTRRDKYRQVEEFLRALEPVLPDTGAPVRAVDLGCGNAYLTFATYAFLARGGRDVGLVGVDVKAQAREHNTAVAERLGWAGHVRFVEGTIAEAPLDSYGEAADARPDLVLALHACDTATDDALARAVRWTAPVLLAAPCCHHDVQRQLREGAGPPEPYGTVARHGILRERLADLLTDAFRAALLRLLGYRVDVVEFVGGEHTPRNVMIRAVRTGAPAPSQGVAEYLALTTQWGVTPALERLLATELEPVLGRRR